MGRRGERREEGREEEGKRRGGQVGCIRTQCAPLKVIQHTHSFKAVVSQNSRPM